MLVSIMEYNEIGVIQPLKDIESYVVIMSFFHTDCAQAIGKIPLDVDKMNIDLMSISGHKIYAPKGIGALYVEENWVRISAMISDGGQERGMRSGTLSPALMCWLG